MEGRICFNKLVVVFLSVQFGDRFVVGNADPGTMTPMVDPAEQLSASKCGMALIQEKHTRIVPYCDPPAKPMAGQSVLLASQATLDTNQSSTPLSLAGHGQVPSSSSSLLHGMKLKQDQKLLQIAQEPTSKFHEAVGKDGAIMIVLERMANRADYAMSKLNSVGIYPTTIGATDGSCTSQEALNQGCVEQYSDAANGACWGKTGEGCVSQVESAISDSHRRALEMAQARDEEWTAIFEDDAVPVTLDGVDWDAEFGNAWARRPEAARYVRLSWCRNPEVSESHEPTSTEGGRFQYMELHFAGGCTTAYMVHKEIIPELLQQVFPCCCAVDCCFERDFFDRKAGSGLRVDLSASGADAWIASHAASDWGTTHGIMMQAKNELGSTRSFTMETRMHLLGDVRTAGATSGILPDKNNSRPFLATS